MVRLTERPDMTSDVYAPIYPYKKKTSFSLDFKLDATIAFSDLESKLVL